MPAPHRPYFAPEDVSPAAVPPSFVPPANVYEEDEDEVEEIFHPVSAERLSQAFRGINPLLVVAIVLLNLAGTLALVLFTLERNVELTELPTKPTRPKVEPTENVTGAQRQFYGYDGVEIDTPEMYHGDPASSDDAGGLSPGNATGIVTRPPVCSAKWLSKITTKFGLAIVLLRLARVNPTLLCERTVVAAFHT
ncbi:hypothetical protein MRX96_017574 [Rhipicephalus microplus]